MSTDRIEPRRMVCDDGGDDVVNVTEASMHFPGSDNFPSWVRDTLRSAGALPANQKAVAVTLILDVIRGSLDAQSLGASVLPGCWTLVEELARASGKDQGQGVLRSALDKALDELDELGHVLIIA